METPLFDTEPTLERAPQKPSALDKRLVPHKALLAELNPPVAEICSVLVEAGVPDVVARYQQANVEQRVRSQKRRAAQMQADFEEMSARLKLEAATKPLPDGHPGKIVVYPSWISTSKDNRASRRASRTIAEHNRRAREKKHLSVLQDKLARGKRKDQAEMLKALVTKRSA